ncbi:MAG TPA: SDR family oxidoreductase [Candidatus Eisenbacteria bacterium]|nr:SDR family oxidoreductase [Candidatus Eisenbacteria bacterium]
MVTGAARGIGAATARRFHKAGWRVIGIDRCRAEALCGIDRFILADLSDAQGAEDAFAELTDSDRRIDALINNAAIQICKPLVETSPEEWDAVMACNVRSVYLAVREAYRLIRGHGGAIVNVSSVHAVATSANIAAYAASKGAVLALTRALAIELAPDRIRVNAVLPGAVNTPMLHAGLNRTGESGNTREIAERLAKRHLMGRLGSPEEIAEAILFLADDEHSSFMTGQALVIDGGATTRLSTES